VTPDVLVATAVVIAGGATVLWLLRVAPGNASIADIL
jgi:hypothetical protein